MADRSLAPLDLGAVQARVRQRLAAEPDPTRWPESEQLIMALSSELARLGRLVTRAQAPPATNGHGRQATGEGVPCACCGGLNMTRAGACLVCLDCGTSGGCG